MASHRATSKFKNWIHFNLTNIDRTTKTDKGLCGVEEPSAESKIHGQHTKLNGKLVNNDSDNDKTRPLCLLN